MTVEEILPSIPCLCFLSLQAASLHHDKRLQQVDLFSPVDVTTARERSVKVDTSSHTRLVYCFN